MSTRKTKKGIIMIISLFLSGNLISFIGLTKGSEIASMLSRPRGARSWGTSQEMVMGCTYVLVILGMSLVVLSILFSVIVFINWIKSNQ